MQDYVELLADSECGCLLGELGTRGQHCVGVSQGILDNIKSFRST